MAAIARSLDDSSAVAWLRGFEPAARREQRSFPVLLPPAAPAPPGESDVVRRLLDSLNPAIAAKVTVATGLAAALARQRRDDALPTMLEPFDELLGGGLPRGKLVEIAARRGAGRFSIVLASLAAATAAGEAAVLVDTGGHFDPQIAIACGVDLRRMLWIRPNDMRQAMQSAEAVISSGFQLMVIDGGIYPVKGRAVDAAWVRLTRAAEAYGTSMLVSMPYPTTRTASEAVVAARTVHAKWAGQPDGPRVLASISIELTLQKHRHVRPGKRATLLFRTAEAISGAGETDRDMERRPDVLTSAVNLQHPRRCDARRIIEAAAR
ncbi:MAG TPA: hypothetical protein VFL80_11975 [Thermoanaerobaculia bacterium]|nr:hypothetical protein [Thermoanaerobaculia bacterium]